MNLPEPFVDVIELDRRLAQPVVLMQDLKARRLAGRLAAVYLKGPKGSEGGPTGGPTGGTPAAVAA